MISQVVGIAIYAVVSSTVFRSNSQLFDLNALTVKTPITVTVDGNISDTSAAQFERDMLSAFATKQPIIPIVINSYGGSVYAVLHMLDVLDSSPVPIATIVVGKAMSAGAVLLTCGKEGMRFAAPNSTIMIHEVSTMTIGKVSDIEVDAAEGKRLNKILFERMAKNIGKNKNYFYDQVQKRSNADWFIEPEDAVKHNIINKIGYPKLNVRVNIALSLE